MLRGLGSVSRADVGGWFRPSHRKALQSPTPPLSPSQTPRTGRGRRSGPRASAAREEPAGGAYAGRARRDPQWRARASAGRRQPATWRRGGRAQGPQRPEARGLVAAEAEGRRHHLTHRGGTPPASSPARPRTSEGPGADPSLASGQLRAPPRPGGPAPEHGPRPVPLGPQLTRGGTRGARGAATMRLRI